MPKRTPEPSMAPRRTANDQWGEVTNMVPMSEMINYPRELDDFAVRTMRHGHKIVPAETPLGIPGCGTGIGHRTHSGGRKYRTGNEE